MAGPVLSQTGGRERQMLLWLVLCSHNQKAERYDAAILHLLFFTLFFFLCSLEPCPWMVLPIQLNLFGKTLSQTHLEVCLLGKSKSKQVDSGNLPPHKQCIPSLLWQHYTKIGMIQTMYSPFLILDVTVTLEITAEVSTALSFCEFSVYWLCSCRTLLVC